MLRFGGGQSHEVMMQSDGQCLPCPEPDAGISTAVTATEDFTDVLHDDEWVFSSAALAPGRLRRVAADARWRSWFVIALWSGAPVGLLPLYRSKRASFAAPIYDPTRVAPQLFGPCRADEYLLIGGNTELVSGATLAASLDRALVDGVRTALVDAAFDHAGAQGLIGASLYVRDGDIEGFRAGRAVRAVGEFATLPVPGATPEHYLSMLNHGRRSVVRRDWRALDSRGLRSTEVDAADLVDDAVDLVVDVKRRHGVTDHPD
jgi:hypothetical protein